MRALSIMDAIIEVCSRTPEISGVNSFWIFVSINSFLARKERIESRKHDDNNNNSNKTTLFLKLLGLAINPDTNQSLGFNR